MSTSNFRIRTPLGQVRGLGSAGSGTHHFWLQRVTAAANLFLAFAFVIVVIALAGRDYAAAKSLLAQPLVALLMALFTVSGCIHMRLGMDIVIEDYVTHEGLKILAKLANIFFPIIIGAACLFAILKLALGA